MNPTRRTILRAGAALGALTLVVSACGSDDKRGSASASSGSSPTTGGSNSGTPSAIDEARCAENKAAGKITYLSGFDFSAHASIVDVIVAKERGYFDELCLDVDLKPSFSTANYPLIASDQAQFASAGNYTEIINFTGGGAEFVAVAVYGKSPIEALITPGDGATSLPELKGRTIGVKGDIPPSIVALLASAGLRRGTDYKEILLDGFDPVAQLASGIDALPVFKSNEPGQLDAQGIPYHLFDPVDEKIPGSFGVLYTSKKFATEHPSAVADFTRASLRGMQDALADPEGAARASMAAVDAAGNKNFLTEQGELYRWQKESEIVVASTPAGEPVGVIDPERLRAEYDAYVAADVWPDGPPAYGEYFDAGLARSLYGADGKVTWPG